MQAGGIHSGFPKSRNMRRFWLLFSQAVTVLLAAYFVVVTLKPEWLRARPMSVATSSGVALTEVPTSPNAPPPLGSFRVAAQKASQAVVSINTSKAADRPAASDPWFRFFFGDQGGAPQAGLGSGVIISPEGFILTNNHVVEGATEIEVALNDSRKAQAKVIGTDPETDLAILKIDLERLPVITLGNSDALQVGDQVLAIGNPFGVGRTVTSGIVSALGRNQLGINTFENFIQTDAAINPGNSGGALVDVNGNLLGINTAIYSRSGGSLGIGFAIPVTTARQVMEGLIKDGQVTRGWIGVEPRDLTPEIAKTLDLSVTQGVLITGVVQAGPASEGGLRPGDVVTRIAGTPVANTPQLLNAVAALKPHETATIRVQRGDSALDVKVTVAQRPKSRPMQQ